jgi:hypothetical protein
VLFHNLKLHQGQAAVSQTYQIGYLAKLAGVPVETIRYYEAQKLMLSGLSASAPPIRNSRGSRARIS